MQSIWQEIAELDPPIDSAVDFPTRMRFHMALNVQDVEALVPFYQAFLGIDPSLVRDGYAKFELQQPPLNLSLNRVVHNAKGHGRFGLEAQRPEFVAAASARLSASRYSTSLTPIVGALPAFAVTDPENNRWLVTVPERRGA